ncbi:uncharacterized protein LOC129001031 [Macrosteles quadrilineatus]|uniref:uncharacterized protein LOC129001031 n=1 Tax=Macrosteles quadrilineatus TaxID=74068 RepID=UPI0023E0CE91|nr:uncharacterized protein LOC129001031 [Macrosteles quadrilineatus]
MITIITLLVVLIQLSSSQLNGKKEDGIPEGFAVYTSLDKLLDFFRNQTDPIAKDIVETFLRDCVYPGIHDGTRNALMKPVIVMEGNHRSSRDIISMGLAEIMNARYLIHPAPCIYKFHTLIPKGTLLRRAFYLLSDYAVSYYAKANFNRPIVINGYWTEKMAFAMSHTYTNETIPPLSSDVFKWPEGLLKPDFIFYLTFPEALMSKFATTRSPQIWKRRMLQVYEYMSQRHPIVITEIKSLFKLTTEDIHRHIRQNFYDKFQNMTFH